MDILIEDKFIEEVKKAFLFLLDRGFVITTQPAGSAHIMTQVTYLGKNVAIILAFDHRIQVRDLYIAQVKDGRINAGPEGGYMDHFGAYLIKYHKFRGSFLDKKMIPNNYKNLSLEEQIQIDLQVYADALKRYGQIVLEDSENAFRCGTA